MTQVDTQSFNYDARMLYIPDFKQHLESKGIYVDNVYFDLNRKGAGACFEGRVNSREFILAHNLYNEFRAIYVNNIPSLKIKSKDPHYNHAETMCVGNRNKIKFDIDCKSGFSQKCSDEFEDFVDYVLSCAKDYANEFYNRMDNEYWSRLDNE